VRRAANKDSNQTEIVSGLRKIGCTVAITSMVGKGFPDIVVGYQNKNYLFEIKDGNKSPSKQKLRSSQIEWHQLWNGSVHVVNSITVALSILDEK
jgi:Holliday junction resolvase